MKIEYFKLTEIIPYAKNPRKNDNAVKSVASSIKEFGFKVPIIIDSDHFIICGHTRFKAAEQLKIETIPCIIADDLTEAQVKAYRLLDNKLAEKSEWDSEMLSLELADLSEMDIDLSIFDVDFSDDKFPEVEIDPDVPRLDEIETNTTCPSCGYEFKT